MPPRPEVAKNAETYHDIKMRLHDRLIELMDLTRLESMPPEVFRSEVAKLSEKLLNDDFRDVPLNQGERERLVREIHDEMRGHGPLEPFLHDPTVNDILVNTFDRVYVERNGKLELTEARFKDNSHLKKIIDRIVNRVGRRVDETTPMVDARLPDGSRVNVIIPPLSIDGPVLSIRKFSKDPLELSDLIRFKSIPQEMSEILQSIVRGRMNILISGGTGSGKTTLLNCLSRFIPNDERIVTIEDAAELQLKQEHVVRLETRPANLEGKGEVAQRDLVRNSLRMRPDRIIVGEVRGAEALDMLQAMNTGHDGSLATVHANTPRDALMRLETMMYMAGFNMTSSSLKRYISSAIDVVVQIARLSDGTRKMISFQEITGMEGEVITMQEIFAFEQHGLAADGKVRGRYVSRGIRPRFSERIEAKGFKLPGNLFVQRTMLDI
ncbi:CpaF family protein [Fundidesulfovibrio soli]|uniref:CpaF family protein n=1 Tax=Fundidesulfovibrio soli TaxID=2922716 RepID=UPI001FAFAE59|nr:CpaF family protein [Fundidesulfovibrio soli]